MTRLNLWMTFVLVCFSSSAFASTVEKIECRQSQTDRNAYMGDVISAKSWGFTLVRTEEETYNLAYRYSDSKSGIFTNSIIASELSCKFDTENPLKFSCTDSTGSSKCVYSTKSTGDSFYDTAIITKKSCLDSNVSIPANFFHQTRGASGCFADVK